MRFYLAVSTSPPNSVSSSGAAVLVPLTVAPDWAKDYFCAYRPVQGKIWCSLTGTHSALWTQGRSCSFVVLFAQHRIDFLSHVTLSGGAKKEQKSKTKKLPKHCIMPFLCPKVSRGR